MIRGNRLLGILIFLFISIPAAAGFLWAAEPVAYTLPNGMKVILIENHRAPVASMLVWVKVGSASEEEGQYGLAHVMEHMLFKGTDERAPGDIAREIESSGGEINAYTSYDQTVYYVNIASRFAERGLVVLEDLIFDPTFDPEEYAREKEVVIEELKQGEDQPTRELSKSLFRTAYRVHPYGRPVIGYSETVRGVSRDEALAFHDRWYVPSNMVLVLAGDFDPEKIKALIADTFGRREEKPGPADKRVEEPPQSETRVSILRKDVQTVNFQMAFHIPAYAHPDIIGVDLLAEVLGSGRTSRLYRVVQREKELVTDVGAGSYTPQDPGLFVVSGQTSPDKVLPAIEAVSAELARIGVEGPSKDEMSRTRLNVQSYFVYSRETMGGEARVAANFEIMAGDFREKDVYLAEVEQTGAEDLRVVAARYLRPENLTVSVLLPEGVMPELNEQAVAAAATRGWAAVPGEQPAAARAAEEFREFTLDNGAKLLVKEDHSLPIVAVRSAFLGGIRFENAEKSGLFNLLAEVWDRGTETKSADELARAVEDMAGAIGSFSGRNSFGLEAGFLSRYLDRGLDLYTEVLTRPALLADEVEKARPVIMDAIRKREEQPASQAFLRFSKVMYEGHPYARDMLGTAESVTSITAEDLRAFYERYARPEGMILTVVGDVEAEAVRDRFNTLLAGWTGKVDNPPAIARPTERQGLRSETLAMERAQTHLVLGWPAPDMMSPDRYALEVLDRVLSGQGGRLFVKLRDEQSLAYSLSSFYTAGLDTGAFGLYIAFDPAKREQVEKGFQEIVTELKEKPVSAEELQGAKENILGAYEIGLQEYDAQASEAAFNVLYGLGLDFNDRYLAGIQAVSAEDVRKAAEKYLDMTRAVMVTVGPGN